MSEQMKMLAKASFDVMERYVDRNGHVDVFAMCDRIAELESLTPPRVGVVVSTSRPNASVTEVPIADAYLIWSHEHHAWWGPNFCGYFANPLGAGLYTKEAAEAQCGKRYGGLRPDEEARRLVDEIKKWSEQSPTTVAIALTGGRDDGE